MIKEIISYLSSDWEKYKEVFSESLDSQIPLLNSINRYLMENGGKQLRPMLCLLSARLCSGVCNDMTAKCAAVSELLHTASLLHDDVADNAVIRRGRPTVSAMVSSTASVLIGDYWLATAIHAVIEECETDILKVFTKCFEDLAKGEILQLQKAAAMDTTEDDYYKIIECKTASLFRASMKSGAISVGAEPKHIEAVAEYAYHLGLAFQIRDDIMDYSPDFKTGKPVGQDIVERKITLPLLGAMRKLSDKKVEDVKGMMKHLRKHAVIRLVRKYGGIEYAQATLESETAKAIEALGLFTDSEAKGYLSNLAYSLCHREN